MYLIWFDPSTKPLAEKIAAGAVAYRARFGRAATVAQVNPAAIASGAPVVPGIRIEGLGYVQPAMVYIGEESL